MSTYEELIGKRVEFFDSDPTLTTAYEGQVWYNTTSDTLKTVVLTEAYSSGAPVITARRGMSSSKNGTQDAMFGAGGYAAGPSTVASTEEYNGSGFSTGGNLSNARYHGTGAGTLTAGLAIGSAPDRTLVEEYDGTSWTAGGAMSTGRGAYDMGCGTQTAAMTAGGFLPPNTANTNATEHYNGSSWTGSGNLTDSRRNHSGCGIQTAAVTFAGDLGPSTTNQVQNYDGSSWTNVTTTPATLLQYMAFGTQTNSVYAGGTPPTSTTSFKYNGTSISSGPAMATARGGAANAGSGTAGVLASGMTTNPTTFTGNTEEFTSSTNVITAAAWASGGSLGTARDSGGSAGTQTAALYFGGYLGSLSAHTESYDGTSWSELSDLNTAKRQVLQGLGTQTAALAFGGLGAPGVSTQLSGTESWNGSSWTALSSPSNQNTAKHNLGSVGTQTAGLKFGGNASYSSATESWNGSAWTTKNSLNTGRTGIRGSGTSTAAIGIGGSSPTIVASVESWDGTNWTASPYSLNTANYVMGCAGPSQTAALIFGGITPVNPVAAISEIFDGSTFSTSPNLATQRYNLGGCGTVSAALAFGGQAPPYSNATEEFTPESTTANIGNFTTS